MSAGDRLGLGSQVRELKIGKSFTASSSSGATGAAAATSKAASSRAGRAAAGTPSASSSGSSVGPAFTTIRYDFKPASVDTNQTGSLEIAEDNRTVTVNVPNMDGNQFTNYV